VQHVEKGLRYIDFRSFSTGYATSHKCQQYALFVVSLPLSDPDNVIVLLIERDIKHVLNIKRQERVPSLNEQVTGKF